MGSDGGLFNWFGRGTNRGSEVSGERNCLEELVYFVNIFTLDLRDRGCLFLGEVFKILLESLLTGSIAGSLCSWKRTGDQWGDEDFGRVTGFFPEVLGWRVDGFNKSNDPYFQRTAFVGNEGKSDAGQSKKKNKRPFKKAVDRQIVSNEGGDETGSKLSELFEGHVADESKLVGLDVLGNGVRFHWVDSPMCELQIQGLDFSLLRKLFVKILFRRQLSTSVFDLYRLVLSWIR